MTTWRSGGARVGQLSRGSAPARALQAPQTVSSAVRQPEAVPPEQPPLDEFRPPDSTESAAVAPPRGARRTSPVRRGVLAALATLTAALAILVLFVPSVFSTILRGSTFWPHSERYTALYFTYPNALVTHAGPRRTLPVTFTVESHEGTRRTYRYEVSIGRSTQTQHVVRTGTLILAPGNSSERTVDIRQVPPGRRLVEVRVVGTGTTISYWTTS